MATRTLKLIYQTAKVRLGFLITACAIAGIVVIPDHGLAAWQVFVLGLGTLVASSAAGAFNQLYERDLDARMQRTRSRPFVTGRFNVDARWFLGIAIATLLALAAAAFATNWLAALFVFLGAFTYGVVYTVWLKRRTWMNIVIGGFAGSFAILAGSAAAGEAFAPVAVILAAVLFLWTPPHFWALAFACKEDYRAAGVPMLPVVVGDRTSTRTILAHAIAVALLSLLPLGFGLGWLYGAAAIVGGTWFIITSLRLVADPGRTAAWRTFAASIVQLGLLIVGVIMDRLLLG